LVRNRPEHKDRPPSARSGALEFIERAGERVSQIQIDKLMTVARARVGGAIGRLDDATMLKATRSLAVFGGIA
jgi:mRNA-degrading endonuclease toxin of MazEF toxin-antitoxin module